MVHAKNSSLQCLKMKKESEKAAIQENIILLFLFVQAVRELDLKQITRRLNIFQ